MRVEGRCIRCMLVCTDEGNGGVGSCSYSKGRGFDDD